jgi:hypothetical protein
MKAVERPCSQGARCASADNNQTRSALSGAMIVRHACQRTRFGLGIPPFYQLAACFRRYLFTRSRIQIFDSNISDKELGLKRHLI